MKNMRGKIKKIMAVTAGLFLAGSTVLGAADLNQYPVPFIKNGVFNGALVIGDKAAAEDVIGVTDIAVGLQYSAVTKKVVSTKTDVEVEGDVFEIKTGGESLNLFESMNNVVNRVDKSDLTALKDDTLTNSKGHFDYNQYIYLGAATITFEAGGNSTDDPELYLKFNEYENSDDWAFKYELSFPTAARSDIDSNGDLEDFNDEVVTILGKEYTISNADLHNGQLRMSLMGGAAKDVLEEGGTKTYVLNGISYEVTATVISDETSKAKFAINGETTRSLGAGDTYTLDDGTQIGVREVIPNEAGDAVGDMVEFYLGAEKIVFEDSNDGEGTLTVGDDELSNVAVNMFWTNSSDEISLNRIQLIWQPSEDVFVPVEGTLSNYLSEEDDISFLEMTGLDFEFVNLINGEEDKIEIKSSGDKNIEIELITKSDEKIKEDLFWLNGSTVVLGQNNDRQLYFTEGDTACEKDLFIVENNKDSYLLQLKKVNSDKLEIIDLGTDDTEEISDVQNGTNANFYKGGIKYTLSDIDTTLHCLVLNDTTDDGIDGTANLWTKNGAQLVLNEGYVRIYENKDDNKDDDSGDYDYIDTNISVSGSKLTLDDVNIVNIEDNISMNLIPLDSNDDISQAYTKWGTFIEWNTDSDMIKVNYPEEEAVAKVYLTSGITQLVPSIEGAFETELINKIEVGATKLASEITDVNAQNLIVVGGPCANVIAATLMGDPADCTLGFAAERGIIELFEQENGNVAILVAGLTKEDTKKTAEVLTNYDEYKLSGKKVIIDTKTGSIVKEPANNTTVQ